MKHILTLLFLLPCYLLFSQNAVKGAIVADYPYAAYFEKAYQLYPQIPKGTLEAISFTMTRINHLDASSPGSCTGMPRTYGVMGLTLDGKGHFRNNLWFIAKLSGYTENEIISSPEINILAYAKAYSQLLFDKSISGTVVQEHIPVIIELSELPLNGLLNDFALSSHIYSVLTFLNKPDNQQLYHFPPHNIDMVSVFGQANYDILSAPYNIASLKSITNKSGQQFKQGKLPVTFSADYPPALWNAAASCNYTVGRTVAVSAVVVHDVEGTYAGAISWFKNCNSSVSAHYVLRSSDGQVTQMVLEKDKAWHVGSENPYTIGLEHEGFISDASWYTNAMYVSSADLVRDICNSGYGINPLRCYYGPSCSGLCPKGSCVKIKGHQMYPNQTHSDPGPNWNWYKYYELINNTTPITTLSTSSGNFYDSGGPAGNYADDERTLTLINPPGATSITLTVNSFNLELNWDYMYIYDGPNLSSPLIGTYTGTTIPATVTSSSGSMLIQFRSDCATTAAGWNISWTSVSGAVNPANLMATVSNCPNSTVNLSWTNTGNQWFVDVSTDTGYATFFNKDVSNLTSTACPAGFCDYPNCTQSLSLQANTTYYWRIWNGSSHTSGGSFTVPDCIIPTTSVAAPSGWITNNFTASFADNDNVGVEKSYYQVIDFDGTEWRANNTRGFFSDNFDVAIHPDWTVSTGTWAIQGGYLVQSDEVPGNTNLYASLTQNLSNRYFYHWQGKIEGTGTDKRAGFHFFCSDGSLPNHGNSYFVWFREDNNKLQFYEVLNDTFNLVKDVVFTFNPNQWYDFKVTYDRTTGKISVYIDNVFADSYTDASPYSTGSYIAFRSANCKYTVNDLKVYRSRPASVTVDVGTCAGCDIRYQNPNPSTPSGRIKSIVNDANDNLSAIALQDVNVDWTPPSDVNVSDGTTSDIDTTTISTELSANWTTSADPNSGVVKYWYAMGTSAGATDVVNWTSSGINTFVTHTGLILTIGQTYYVSVKAEDGAGLFSNVLSSDGQYLKQAAPPPTASFSTGNTTVCTGQGIQLLNNSIDATNYIWDAPNGTLSSSTATNPMVLYNSSGSYMVTLYAYGASGTSDTLTQTINVTVNPKPVAVFSGNPTVAYLPNAAVSFTNTSSNSSSYIWNFGDGDTSTAAQPSHTYSVAGIYTVTLIATSSLCPSDTLIKNNYITVNADTTSPKPVASFFTSGFGYVCAGNPVSYYDASTNATLWNWSFPGGSPSSSTNQNPAVVYGSSGSYSTTLIAIGPGGSDTLTQSVNVNIVNPPVAAFSTTDTVVTLPSALVSFSNSSVNATSYTWNFGDTNTSSLQAPSHQYADTGYYSVSLIASNDNCPADTLAMTNYIHVLPPPQQAPPSSAFSVINSGSICSGTAVNFINSSVNATSYQWILAGGNPSSSTVDNPSVVYSNSGTYSIVLIAYGQGGSDTMTQNVTVNIVLPPVASFSADSLVVNLPPAAVNFTNTSVNATSYLWNFGDSSVSAQLSPSHQYADTGFYTVTLIAQNQYCPSDTEKITNYIHVVKPTVPIPPSAWFTVLNTGTLCKGTPVNFQNNSTNATSYLWNFSGATPSSSTAQNPSVVYDSSGTYSVSLIAYGPGGSDTVTQNNTVNIVKKPIASFSATDTTITLPPGMVFFTNSSSNASGYIWYFGDGGSATDESPWHQYSDTGYYTITLIAKNAPCVNDTLIMTSYIHVAPPVGIGNSADLENNIVLMPNPVTQHSVIRYNLSTKDNVSLKLIDYTGRTIAVLSNSSTDAGTHYAVLDVATLGLANGIYSLQYTTGGISRTLKIAVVK